MVKEAYVDFETAKRLALYYIEDECECHSYYDENGGIHYSFEFQNFDKSDYLARPTLQTVKTWLFKKGFFISFENYADDFNKLTWTLEHKDNFYEEGVKIIFSGDCRTFAEGTKKAIKKALRYIPFCYSGRKNKKNDKRLDR